MPTPREGTLQHRDLESLSPRPFFRLPKWLASIDVEFVNSFFFFFVAVSIYNTVACALGRFFLDHFHLWNRTIPPDARSLDKHGELVAAFLASCLSLIATVAILYLCTFLDDVLRVRGKNFEILTHNPSILGIIIFSVVTMVPVAGAIIHPGLHYVNPVSMLAVYGFGSVLLIPSLALLFVIVVWTL
ncbi:hypothetical protein DL96DRAFT_1611256 [Flagelloscypha sp. PMI_526]|nr:hypothetical protein DL96DRAFT_1611256 [Flagelloscypha sp. PMI_526]